MSEIEKKTDEKAPEKKGFFKYIPALLAAVVAIVGLVFAVIEFEGSEGSWKELAAQVDGLGKAADQAAVAAVEEEDFVVCVASEATASLSYAVASSLGEAAEGACQLPDVSVDISACVPFAEKMPEGKDVPAAVEMSISPVLSLISGLIDKGEDAKVKAWAKGTVEWLGSGQKSIIALIEDPASGKFELKGVKIDECSVEAAAE